jgi:hypothetical protein
VPRLTQLTAKGVVSVFATVRQCDELDEQPSIESFEVLTDANPINSWVL